MIASCASLSASLARPGADPVTVGTLNPLVQKLAGGDRRSIGRSPEDVADVLARPELFERLIAAMLNADPLIRMRAADAAEKASAQRPELLQPHKQKSLTGASACDQQEICWHVAQILPRLELTPGERAAAVAILNGYLSHKSRIVQVCAMQALADITHDDASLRPRVVANLEELTTTCSATVRVRG